MSYKYCRECDEMKHVTEFYKNSKGKYKFLRYDCIECKKAKDKKYYERKKIGELFKYKK